MIKPPKRLRSRPQWRGLPIPYIALIRPDGTPDFRVTDQLKRHSVMMNRWCQLCGEPLGKYFFFIGGPQAAQANAYFEPAAHLDCLIYAMQVCPFIAGKMEHADLKEIQSEYDQPLGRTVTAPEGVKIQVHSDDTMSAVKNPLWVIKKASGWRYAKTPDGTILIVPHPVIKVTQPLHAETIEAPEWRKIATELARG